LRKAKDAKRRLQYTWVMTVQGKSYISVDTLLANKIVLEALKEKTLKEFSSYSQIRPEFTFEDSRFDFGLRHNGTDVPADCIIEVKSTTMADGQQALFPDARTQRGRKHLQGLISAKKQGIRAVQFFCISRNDSTSFAPAAHIDPDYAAELKRAHSLGVEVMAW